MKKIQLLIFLVICLSSINGISQTIGAGEITYHQYARYKYKVTAIVYRQCSNAALNSLTGYVESDSFKTLMNFKRVSISKTGDTCGNPCNSANAPSNAGYEKHVFEDTIDFTKAPYTKYVKAGNCNIYFSIHQYLRDTSITTIVPDIFYLNAMVNICQNISNNHSPVFNTAPDLIACCNQPFLYNAGVNDKLDKDSLAFSLEAPLNNYNSTIAYTGNFTSKIPMTPYCPPNPGVINCRALPSAKPPRGFYFDAETGDIIFTPVLCTEYGVIKTQVREYRKDSTNKYVLIGHTSREMMLQVKVCPDNNPPYFTSNNKYAVCEGNKICFTVVSKDDPFLPKQTKPDTIVLSWNQGIPEGVFKITDTTAREKEAQFCWQTKIGDARPNVYTFTALAKDNNCPYPGTSARGYTIMVKPKARSKRTYTKGNCGWLKVEAYPLDTINQNIKNNVYQFHIRNSTNSGVPYYSSYKRVDSVKFKQGGTYIIEHSINNIQYNCPTTYYDTVTIDTKDIEIAFSQDTLVCQNDSVTLQPINGNFSSNSIRWYDNEIGVLPVDSGLVYTSKIHGLKKTIRIEMRDNNNCNSADSVTLYSRGAFETDPDGRLFSYCTQTIDTIRIKQIKGTAPFTIEWYKDNQFAGSDSALALNILNNTKIRLKISDNTNCSAEDTILITTIQTPIIGMSDTAICLNDTARILSKVNPSNVPFNYYWILDGQLSFQNGENFDLVVNDTHQLKLKINTSGACESEKTIDIFPLPLPNFTIIGDTVFNKANYIVLSASKVFNAYKWSNGANTKDNGFWAYTLGAPGVYNQALEVTDSNGCKSVETHGFRTNGLTGIDKAALSNIVIHPNPFTESISIESKEDGTYSILNTEGKIVAEGLLTEGKQSIQLKYLSAGIYYLQINGQKYPIIKSN